MAWVENMQTIVSKCLAEKLLYTKFDVFVSHIGGALSPPLCLFYPTLPLLMCCFASFLAWIAIMQTIICQGTATNVF